MSVQNGTPTSSRKRRAGAMSSTSFAQGDPAQPLVPATSEGLAEMGDRVGVVVVETSRNRDGSAEEGKKNRQSESGRIESASHNGLQQQQKQKQQKKHPSKSAYLKPFQCAIMNKVRSASNVRDDRERRETEDLVIDINQFVDEMQVAMERLRARRAQVSRLSDETCREHLRIAKTADDRASTALQAKADQARKQRDDGETLLLPDSALSSIDDIDAVSGLFAGIDGDVLEPKVSLLIGKLSELPGPLKSVLQEIPELTASLAKMVQNVEEAMSIRESRTEELLNKAPPTPLSKGSSAVAITAGGAGSRHPPEEMRAAARETRVEQAMKEWGSSAGVGMLGERFS